MKKWWKVFGGSWMKLMWGRNILQPNKDIQLREIKRGRHVEDSERVGHGLRRPYTHWIKRIGSTTEQAQRSAFKQGGVGRGTGRSGASAGGPPSGWASGGPPQPQPIFTHWRWQAFNAISFSFEVFEKD